MNRGETHRVLGGRLTKVGILFGLWTLVGLIFVAQYYAATLISKNAQFELQRAVWSVAGWYMWVLFTPIVFWLARQVPIERPRWARAVAAHLGLAFVVSLTEVCIFATVLYFATDGAQPLVRDPNASLSYRIMLVLLRSLPFDLFVYGTVVAVAHAFDYQKRFRARELAASQLQAQLARAELEALKMQLHPHFLFNTLHAISALMDDDVKGARRMLAQLSELLRLSLEKAEVQEVSLEEELDFLDRYLEIERVRFDERLTVIMDIEDGTLRARVPNLILQPLVENAIKHGIAPYRAAGRIEIGASREGDYVQLRVRDNGPGLRQQASGRAGIGLANTRARLRQLYGADHAIEFTNLPEGGLEVLLTIPFCTGDSEPFPRPTDVHVEHPSLDRGRRAASPAPAPEVAAS